MEIFADPTIWAGFITLVILEIVLGIDNLIFIAILADKLPPHLRDRARVIGLTGALVMRLALLASMSWMMGLTATWFTLFGHAFSGRDTILLVGGLFLLFKATAELHDRLEGDRHDSTRPKSYAGFWGVVAQIMVLDAVFSIDAVITAIGMVDHLPVMMAAVIVAILLMIVASKPLTRFVSAHPTVIVLCLGFLLMIGFSLVAEGLGFVIPKGYLYAAIGFSVLIEAFNQWGQFKRKRQLIQRSLRSRTANAVLRLMGGKTEVHGEDIAAIASVQNMEDAFSATERHMIRGVLGLAEKPVRYIMTPRPEIQGVSAGDSIETMREKIMQSPFSRLVYSEGMNNEASGILVKKEMLRQMLETGEFNPVAIVQPALHVPENKPVLEMLEVFKGSPVQMAFVVDEFGSFQGIVTQNDVLEAIAGDLPEEHESQEPPLVQLQGDGSYLVDGRTDVDELRDHLTLPHLEDGDFHTVAGLVLHVLQTMPAEGDHTRIEGWDIEVMRMDGNRIQQLRFTPTDD